ncbi:MAG: hypothetical protein KBC16_03105 [Candidatus Pacebacteria bacterium]|nr:hypothetical protein [Candidatus Paceibacterota bacterium]
MRQKIEAVPSKEFVELGTSTGELASNFRGITIVSKVIHAKARNLAAMECRYQCVRMAFMFSTHQGSAVHSSAHAARAREYLCFHELLLAELAAEFKWRACETVVKHKIIIVSARTTGGHTIRTEGQVVQVSF